MKKTWLAKGKIIRRKKRSCAMCGHLLKAYKFHGDKCTDCLDKLNPETNLLKRAGLNPHVHTKIQLKKMTKAGLIRLVIKLEKFIVSHAYEMYKSKLPRLKTIKRKALPYNGRIDKRRKTKRKFSRKQLAAQRLFAKRARAGTLRRRKR